MPMSTITVAGISPTLKILGATQQFNYSQELSTFQITNSFIPTALILSTFNFEFRNNLFSGFRWIHSTSTTDTYGSLTLQNFVNAQGSGNNMITFDSDGISISVPLNLNSQINGSWNGSTITVPYGGTGITSSTPYSVICGGTTSTGTLQSVTSVGTAGQVLTSQGAGALPTWSSAGTGSLTSITAGTGLSGGTITSSGTIAISDTTVTAGNYTYGSFTVNAQGQLTSASNGTTPLLPANNLSDLVSAATSRTNLGLTNIATQVVTQNNVLIGGASNTITSTPLTNGQLLIGSTGGAPTATIPNDGTNISWVTGAGSLTANLSGQIALTNGGTNASLTASNGGIFYSTATSGAILGGTVTANKILLSGANDAPSWSTAVYPSTTTANQIIYSSANNVLSELSTANNGVLVTSSGGVPSINTTLPNQVQQNITAVGTITSGTWNSDTIAVPYGGTGITSSTPYSVICGGTTSTSALQSVASVGAAGEVLTSQGTGFLPIWSSRAYCNAFLSAATTTVYGAVANVYLKINAPTSSSLNNLFTHTSNRLTYTGTNSIVIQVNLTLDCTLSGTTNLVYFRIFKNGINPGTFCAPVINSATSTSQNISLNCLFPMVTNDFIEIWSACGAASRTLTVTNVNFTAIQV